MNVKILSKNMRIHDWRHKLAGAMFSFIVLPPKLSPKTRGAYHEIEMDTDKSYYELVISVHTHPEIHVLVSRNARETVEDKYHTLKTGHYYTFTTLGGKFIVIDQKGNVILNVDSKEDIKWYCFRISSELFYVEDETEDEWYSSVLFRPILSYSGQEWYKFPTHVFRDKAESKIGRRLVRIVYSYGYFQSLAKIEKEVVGC